MEGFAVYFESFCLFLLTVPLSVFFFVIDPQHDPPVNWNPGDFSCIKSDLSIHKGISLKIAQIQGLKTKSLQLPRRAGSNPFHPRVVGMVKQVLPFAN